MIPYDQPPPDHDHEPYALSEEQIEQLAKRVAVIIKRDLFADIGETVVKKALYIIGIGVVVLAAWLGGKGMLK